MATQQKVEIKVVGTNMTVKEVPEKVAYNKIVSDDLQMELLDLRDNIRNNSFRIGDIAMRVLNDAERNGLNVTQTYVWAAVGSFVGYSARTIRYYAETADFFSKEVREKYDILPFSHFVYARYKGNKWEAVLEYAFEHPGISEAGLDYWYRTEVLGEAISQLEEVAHREEQEAVKPEPKPVVQPADLVATLGKLVDTAEKLMYDMDDEDGVMQEVALHVSAIRNLLPQLRVRVAL